MSSTSTSYLLDLPAELRIRIFEYAYKYHDSAHQPVLIDCSAFQRYAQDFVNACRVSRQVQREIQPIFYGQHEFSLKSTEVDVPRHHSLVSSPSPRLDSGTTVVYGRHRKHRSVSTQEFRLRMPSTTARNEIKRLKLRLLPPGAERDMDFDWSWNKVQYELKSSDFLWPLANLSKLGFLKLESVEVCFVIKLYFRGGDNAERWDRGFKNSVEAAVDQMQLSPRPTFSYETMAASVFDVPQSPPTWPSRGTDSDSSEDSTSDRDEMDDADDDEDAGPGDGDAEDECLQRELGWASGEEG